MASSDDISSLSYGTTVVLQIAVACSVIAYLLQLWWNRKWTIGEGQLPPGSMGYFGIGESLDFLGNMHTFFEGRDEKYGNVYKTHIMGSPTVRVRGSEYIKKIFCGDSNTIEEMPAKTVLELLGPSSLTGLKGKDHKERRFQVMNAFKKDYLQHYIPRIYTTMERTINECCGQDTVLVYKKMQQMALEAAWEVVVGLPLTPEEFKHVERELHTFIDGLFTAPFNIPGFPFYKALKAKKELHNYIEKAIGLGDSLPTHTVLGMMLQLKRSSGVEYSTKQIQEATSELLFAGYDTVSSAATSLILCLSRHKDVKNRLMEELRENGLLIKSSSITFDINKMSYLNNVIKEVLRMYPPVGFGIRRAKRSFQLGTYTIPEGWTVIANIRGSMYEADIEDREQFKPERWQNQDQQATDFSYIPFGAGPRICVGREYAKVFLRVFAICLLRTCDVEILSENVEFIQRPSLLPKDYLPARFKYR